MRKLLLSLCLLALPVFATAQQRAALLTPHGTLFTLEQHVTEDESGSTSAYLILRSQHGTDSIEEIVPNTLEGANVDPAMAYDAESRTLFVFWLRRVGITASQLVFAYRDAEGIWSAAEEFGQQYDDRENLRIAITRKVTEEDGSVGNTPAVSVHLVWWEFDSDSDTPQEGARYMMLTIDNGKVVERTSLDLKQFAKLPEPTPEPGTDSEDVEAPAPADTNVDVDRSVLKQPLVFASQSQDSILVVFGDTDTRRLHQVRIRPSRPPVSDGRLRVPVGRQEGGASGPKFVAANNSRIEGIYGDTDRMAIYTRDGNQLSYTILKDGTWSDSRALALDDQLSASDAVDALRRLVNEH
ncbi:MAG: hypothetical protein ACLGH0_13520 [Thermoanaerobaculia bacterium]